MRKKIIMKTSKEYKEDIKKKHNDSLCPECNQKSMSSYSYDEIKKVNIFRYKKVPITHYTCVCGCEWKVED